MSELIYIKGAFCNIYSKESVRDEAAKAISLFLKSIQAKPKGVKSKRFKVLNGFCGLLPGYPPGVCIHGLIAPFEYATYLKHDYEATARAICAYSDCLQLRLFFEDSALRGVYESFFEFDDQMMNSFVSISKIPWDV